MSKSKEQYDAHAKEYDELSRTAIPWVYLDKPTLERLFIPMIVPDTHLLDVGCGSGKVIEFLCTTKASQENMTGIDSSQGLLNIARKNLPKSHFILSDVSSEFLNLTDKFFDLAISVRVFEYLNISELDNAMNNVFKSLKSGGTFFILVGHPLRVNDGDITKYLERGSRSVSLPWGMKVDLYHKTISDYINASINAGFQVSLMDESLTPDILKKDNHDAYKKYISYGATNLVLILKKI